MGNEKPKRQERAVIRRYLAREPCEKVLARIIKEKLELPGK
jgi:hypothetical protein